MTYLPDTHAVHAGRDDLGELGVHALPLDFSTTYPLPDLEQGRDDLARMAQGHLPKHSPVYARLHNPTVGRFENAMAKLESAEAAVAYSTGMAAITAALMAAQMRGDHVISLRPLYGGSDHLLGARRPRWSFSGPSIRETERPRCRPARGQKCNCLRDRRHVRSRR